MTINMIAGVGMLSVGTVGSPWLGFVQDKNIGEQVQEAKLDILKEEPAKFVGVISYPAIDADKEKSLQKTDQDKVTEIKNNAKTNALKTAAILPIAMLICYIILIMYFKSRGGYKAVDLDTDQSSA